MPADRGTEGRTAPEVVNEHKRSLRAGNGIDVGDDIEQEWLENLLTSGRFDPKAGLAVANEIVDEGGVDGFDPSVLAAGSIPVSVGLTAAVELARADDVPDFETVEIEDVATILHEAERNPDERPVRETLDDVADDERWNVDPNDPRLDLVRVERRERGGNRVDADRTEVGERLIGAVSGLAEQNRGRADVTPLGSVDGAGPGVLCEALKTAVEWEEAPLWRVTGVDVLRIVREKHEHTEGHNEGRILDRFLRQARERDVAIGPNDWGAAAEDDLAMAIAAAEQISADEALSVVDLLNDADDPGTVDPETIAESVDWSERTTVDSGAAAIRRALPEGPAAIRRRLPPAYGSEPERAPAGRAESDIDAVDVR